MSLTFLSFFLCVFLVHLVSTLVLLDRLLVQGVLQEGMRPMLAPPLVPVVVQELSPRHPVHPVPVALLELIPPQLHRHAPRAQQGPTRRLVLLPPARIVLLVPFQLQPQQSVLVAVRVPTLQVLQIRHVPHVPLVGTLPPPRQLRAPVVLLVNTLPQPGLPRAPAVWQELTVPRVLQAVLLAVLVTT